MAAFGEALAALEDFRVDLIGRQMDGQLPAAQAMAFRASAGIAAGSSLQNVHATGVGVRGTSDSPGRDDFVIKVYMFDRADVVWAAGEPLLSAALQGVEVDVEYLPVQSAFAPRALRLPKPKAAANPAGHQARLRPTPAGVEIGPLGGDYVGTLGCFVRRGPGDEGPLFVLSNNHVLSNVNQFPSGRQFTQPFSAKAADVICALSDFEPIHFPAPGSQPRNVIDAAIASVATPAQVTLGGCSTSRTTTRNSWPRGRAWR